MNYQCAIKNVCARWLVIPAFFILSSLIFAQNLQPQSISLKQAILIALENNPEIFSARARLEASEKAVEQARAAFFPKIYATMQYTERLSAPSAMGLGLPFGGGIKSIIYQNAVQLQYSPYNGGRNEISLERAKRNCEKTRVDLKATEAEIILTVIEAYLNHLKAKELLRSAKEKEAAIAVQRDNVVRRFKAELAMKSDKLKAEVQLESAREAVIKAENAVAIAENVLNMTMGREENLPLLTQPVASFNQEIPDISVLVQEMEQSNLSLMSMKKQVEILEKSLSFEKAFHRPSLTFSGVVSRSEKDFPPSDKNWSIVGNIEWKVFDGGLQSYKVGEAAAKLREGQGAFQKLRQSLLTQLQNLVLEYKNAVERVRVTCKAEELAREELRLSERQFEEGLITLADHLDNQTEYTQAQVARIVAQFDVELSYYRILKIIGRLTRKFVESIPDGE